MQTQIRQPDDQAISLNGEDLSNIDKIVGRHIRVARLSKSLSLKELSNKLDISLQQLQRYEAGGSRISIKVLWSISRALGYPIAYFYDALEMSSPVEHAEHKKESEQLFNFFHQIKNQNLRQAVVNLASQLSKEPAE